MNCRRAKQLIYDYLDGLITDGDRITLERHLVDCQDCESFSTQLGSSLDLLHRAPEVTPNDNFNWQVRLKLAREKNAIGETIAAQRNIFRTWNLRFALSALSTFVLIVASGVLLWNSGVLSPPSRPLYSDQPATAGTQPAGSNQVAREFPPEPYQYQPSLFNMVGLGDPSSSSGQLPGAIDTAPPRVFNDPDSLLKHTLLQKQKRDRIKLLERQLEFLQNHLRECQSGK